MNKNLVFPIIGTTLIIISILFSATLFSQKDKIKTLEATILSKDKYSLTIQDKNNIIYTISSTCENTEINNNIILEYTGLLDKNNTIQTINITNCKTISTMNENNTLPDLHQDNGIFQKYYNLAYNKVSKMNLDEKISQLLIVQYPNNNPVETLEKFQFGGYLFFEKDFSNKTKEDVINMMNNLQKVVKIPILTAVDEEGGKVVRISSNPNLREEKFLSPSELYREGDFELIHSNTIEKSNLLKELGLNLNLAPVVDVVTNPSAYMYERSFKENAIATAKYAKIVIRASKEIPIVSYTLKHFPGYGNTTDTHLSSATDTRTYEEIMNNDILPFKTGIEEGAEAILVSHNVISNIDNNNPASLSPNIHNILRNELNFTGIIITDDISMGALNNINNTAVKALQAGNDLIITSNYKQDISDIKTAINNKTLSTNLIDKLATRVIAWKYYKGLMFENQK